MDEFKLDEKVGLVIGGTSGIGKTITLALAEAGADVIATSRTLSKVKKTAKQIRENNVNTLEVTTDITKDNEVEKLKNKIINKFGQIDILVNSAGTTIKSNPEELAMKDWNKVIDLNLNSVFRCSQIIGKEMIERNSGNILNISSVGAKLALKGSAPYCSSKGGVEQLTKVLASEWAEYNVRVNCIAPAYFKTPMTSNILKDEEFKNKLTEKIPLKRIGELNELKGAAVFLVSPAASYITGETIFIDGGWTSLGI